MKDLIQLPARYRKPYELDFQPSDGHAKKRIYAILFEIVTPTFFFNIGLMMRPGAPCQCGPPVVPERGTFSLAGRLEFKRPIQGASIPSGADNLAVAEIKSQKGYSLARAQVVAYMSAYTTYYDSSILMMSVC
jgi:hypothetical protein